jgi:hypothetical protein
MATSTVLKDKDTYVYFLYSEQQFKERTKVEKTMSRIFTPGSVIVNGRKKPFTEMAKKSSNRYPDCKVVAEGYKSKMVFTPVSHR